MGSRTRIGIAFDGLIVFSDSAFLPSCEALLMFPSEPIRCSAIVDFAMATPPNCPQCGQPLEPTRGGRFWYCPRCQRFFPTAENKGRQRIDRPGLQLRFTIRGDLARAVGDMQSSCTPEDHQAERRTDYAAAEITPGRETHRGSPVLH